MQFVSFCLGCSDQSCVCLPTCTYHKEWQLFIYQKWIIRYKIKRACTLIRIFITHNNNDNYHALSQDCPPNHSEIRCEYP